jgi:hypothetical protein
MVCCQWEFAWLVVVCVSIIVWVIECLLLVALLYNHGCFFVRLTLCGIKYSTSVLLFVLISFHIRVDFVLLVLFMLFVILVL